MKIEASPLSFQEIISYTQSLLQFVSQLNDQFGQQLFSHGSTQQQEQALNNEQKKFLVMKMVQCLSHFTLLSGIHLNNIENQTFVMNDGTRFVLDHIMPIQHKLMTHYKEFHTRWIAPPTTSTTTSQQQQQETAASMTQDDVDMILFKANYQIVLYSQCCFQLEKSKQMSINSPQQQPTSSQSSNSTLIKAKMDYINEACKLLGSLIRSLEQQEMQQEQQAELLVVDDCPLRLNSISETIQSISVTLQSESHDRERVTIQVGDHQPCIHSIQYSFSIDDQYARALSMRAIFLKDLYKGQQAGQFMQYVKQNFDLAMNSCDRQDALVMFEYAKFNSVKMKEYEMSFLQYFRAARLFQDDDLLRVKALLLSAIDFKALCQLKKETRENQAQILSDLLSEWNNGACESTSEEEPKNDVVSWLLFQAKKQQEKIEQDLKTNAPDVYSHFTTQNRLRQITELYQKLEK